MNISQPVRISKYLPIAILYFFFNGLFLPNGLLYTALLSPLLLIWLYRFPSFKFIGVFLIVGILLSLVHLYHGVDLHYFFRSTILFLSVYIFSLAFYEFLNQVHIIRILYKQILVINIFLVLFALLALSTPGLAAMMWYTNNITEGVESLKRLRMFTYEPSYYSFLLVPIALYYYLKMAMLKLPNARLFFLLVTIPILLSLSFGVILGIIMSLVITFLLGFRRLSFVQAYPAYIFIAIIVASILLILSLILFPENIFFVRIANVFSGRDTSFRGRTFDSFYLAWEIAKERSIFFGVGPGQVKLIGLDYFIKFYNNTNFTVQDIGIPNAVADTLATFGIFGLLLRMGLELYFFFTCKVLGNYYRLCLFLFIFIYQFTGSFLANIAEYVVWVMAFHKGIFEEFDKAAFIFRKAPMGYETSST